MTARSDHDHRSATGLDAYLGAKLKAAKLAGKMSQAALGERHRRQLPTDPEVRIRAQQDFGQHAL